MSAPVLTKIEQKSALSGKKKKKKTIKNVLGIPDNLKVECRFVERNEEAKLQEILNRLLPFAKLPYQRKIKSSTGPTEQSVEDTELREKAKNKRDQLSLGVNSLNKSIKKNLISAVLLANDIQPKFLVNHLNLLCNHYKIPFLYISKLREITATALGFPSIAVGFKIGSCDFLEAVTEVKSLFESSKVITENENQEAEVDTSESDEVEVVEKEICPQNDETPFVYLHRTSIKERAFVPEKDSSTLIQKQNKADFISIEKDSTETDCKKNNYPVGISSNVIRQKQLKAKKLEDFSSKFHDEEELEVPKKKKRKKDWVVDKVGDKKNSKYFPAKLFRIPSNPNRNVKKKF